MFAGTLLYAATIALSPLRWYLVCYLCSSYCSNSCLVLSILTSHRLADSFCIEFILPVSLTSCVDRKLCGYKCLNPRLIYTSTYIVRIDPFLLAYILICLENLSLVMLSFHLAVLALPVLVWGGTTMPGRISSTKFTRSTISSHSPNHT